MAVVFVFSATRSTRAELAVPLIDTTNFSSADFRGLWQFYRSQQTDDDPNRVVENYEAWAVGRVSSGDLTGSGVLYRFQGQQWEQVVPFPLDGAGASYDLPALTAIGGQYDFGSGTPEIWVADYNTTSGQVSLLTTRGWGGSTSDNTIASVLQDTRSQSQIVPICNPLTNTCSGGNRTGLSCTTINDCPSTASCTGLPKRCSGGIYNGQSCLNDNDCPVSLILTNKPLYAIGAAQTYARNVLAGGKDGLLLSRNRSYLAQDCINQVAGTGQCSTNLGITCVSNNPSAPNYYTKVCPSSVPESFRNLTPIFTASGLASAADDVTGIAYVSYDTAYVTTTDFKTTRHPYDRACDGNDSGGANTGKIFRVVGDPNTVADWKLVAQRANTCFFGLAALARDFRTSDAGQPASGPLQNTIWLATAEGIDRVIDNDFSSTASLRTVSGIYPSAPIFGVSASTHNGGDGRNLLLNGDFKAWTTMNPRTAIPPATCPTIAPPNSCNSAVNPDQWLTVNENLREKRGGSCVNDGNQDIKLVSDAIPDANGLTPDYAVQIEPGQGFSAANCPAGKEIDTSATATTITAAVARVPLTGSEGKRYRITGKYKVEFLTQPTLSTPRPTNAIGGVQIACAGAYPPGGVDCSMSSNQYLWVNGSRDPATSYTVTTGSGGFDTIDLTISREDKQLLSPIKGVAASPKNTGGGLVLEIRCVGSYGMRVTCDDLQVQEVNEPSITRPESVTVVGVGQAGLSVVNSNVLSSPANFVAETNPTVGTDLTAVGAIDPAHILAVGPDTTILQRTAGNVSGYIWAGTTSPGESGTAAAGWISTNCANDRDPVSGKSFCQTSPVAYGLTLDNGVLSGRAWFGKQYAASQPNNDRESVNLGQCRNPALKAGNTPYVITGSCNPSTRTCYANANKTCFRDFDCYGRCVNDAGFICLTDEDCQVGGAAEAAGSTITGSQLQALPKFRVQCDQGNRSPLACAAAGWLTFNPTEFSDYVYSTVPPPPELEAASAGQRNYCPGAVYAGSSGGVCTDTSNNSLHGVAQFISLGNPNDPSSDVDRSWVSFRGPTAPAGSKFYGCKSCTVSGGQLTCKYCQDENNQSCTPLPTPPPNVQYPYTCQLYCNGDRSKSPCINDGQCNAAANEVCRAAGYCSLKDGDGNLVACTSNSACQPSYGSCITGADCNPGGGSCAAYGINYDTTTGKFSGYAWSPAYGWLSMAAVQQGNARFIQTRLGDIYATGKIGSPDISPPPANTCNATYLISSAESIVNFCSSFVTGTSISAEQSRVSQIPLISGGNTYTNVLGRLDLTGLSTTASTKLIDTITHDYNKYGSEILRLDSASLPPGPGPGQLELGGSFPDCSGTSCFLGGRVITVGTGAETYSLSANPNFTSNCTGDYNSTATPYTTAAGLLIVNGNLTINSNISYQGCGGSLFDLRQLASLVIVVTGNLTIDNAVTNLVGTYYVQGTVNTASNAASGSNRYPLTVHGLMIGKEFVFGRKFAGTVENPLPSELIILDGRLQSNPLPGMIDFAGALPNTLNTGP